MTLVTTTLLRDSGALAESRLWQAVIVSTIQDWISGPLRLKRQAEEYIFSESSDFPTVCQSAGMDAGQLRRKLLRLHPLRAPFIQSRTPLPNG
jgi:hypothetical protein